MKKVVIRGPVMTQSGYGVHARQFVKYAMKKKDWDVSFQVTPWGITPWQIDTDDPVIKFITERTTTNNTRYDLSIQIQLPNEWDPNLASKNIGVSAVVETDRCNPSWVQCCNRMDAVIFPSSFTEKVVTNTGTLTTASYVINESFPEEFEDDCHIDLELDTDFNFLVYGQITGDNADTDRKNFFYTMRWLCEEFKNNKDVGIVVKTNAGKNTLIDRQITDQMLQKLLNFVRKDYKAPRVHLVHGNLKNSEVGGLYVHPQIKCLVSATRGEGYGLPILEAAAQGLPVIATNWSGHLDFMNRGNFIKLEYDMINVPEQKVDNQIFMSGTKWANVKEDDFKKKVRKFYKSHKTPKDWANSLKTKIRKDFSQSAIEEKMEQAFSEVLL